MATTTDKRSASASGSAVATVRTQLARLVRLVCTVLAALLAVGALLVALRDNVNSDNPVVAFVLAAGDAVDGPFGRSDGPFQFGGPTGPVREALANWGVAALLYLLLGRVLGRLIRP